MNASAAGQSNNAGGMAFVTTRWSVVLAAQGRSPAAQEALETLCRAYSRPLYWFIRRQRSASEEAQSVRGRGDEID
jgi:hypothetical protein